MNIEKYFQYNPELDLTVAQICVHKWDWTSMKSSQSKEAKQLMLRESFDIVPIEQSGKITSYFKTVTFGDYSSIMSHNIEQEDLIYYRLSFSDLIKKMKKENRSYYFLHNSDGILGFISLPQLNCLAVFNYLYQALASLERKMIQYIKSISTEEKIIEILSETSCKQSKGLLDYYKKQKQNNVDNSIYEVLYFSTICVRLNGLEDNVPEKDRGLLKYRKLFSSEQVLGKLRNNVAHPVRPVFSSLESVEVINKVLDIQSEIINMLE